MRPKIIAKATPGGYEVVGEAKSDKDVRTIVANLPEGTYTLLSILREGVRVETVPSATRVTLGTPTATRKRKPA